MDLKAENANVLKLWDTATGTLRKVLTVQPSFRGRRYNGIFSPDSARVLTWSKTLGTLKVYDVVGKLQANLVGHQSNVSHAIFSHDGKLVLSVANDSTLKTWCAMSWKIQQTMVDDSNAAETTVCFSPDNKLILKQVWGRSGKLQVLHANSGTMLHAFSSFQHGRHVERPEICFAKTDCGGLAVVSTGAEERERTSSVVLWDASTGEKHGQREMDPAMASRICAQFYHSHATNDRSSNFTFRSSSIGQLACFSPNGKVALQFDEDERKPWRPMRIYGVESRKVLCPIVAHDGIHDGDVRRSKFSDDGRKLMSINKFGCLTLFDVSTGQVLAVIYNAQAATFSPNGSILCKREGGAFQLWC